MFISKSLAKKLRHSASILLHDGTDETDMPRVAVRQVESVWGKFEPTGRNGGVCVPTLSDGTTQISYADILGYHTGKEASIQPLILKDYFWRSKMPHYDWPDFLRNAAELLLASRIDTATRITTSKLTTTNYWFCDKWYGNRLSFVCLRDAKKAARKQIGVSVTIFSRKTGDIVCFAPASGYCPP